MRHAVSTACRFDFYWIEMAPRPSNDSRSWWETLCGDGGVDILLAYGLPIVTARWIAAIVRDACRPVDI